LVRENSKKIEGNLLIFVDIALSCCKKVFASQSDFLLFSGSSRDSGAGPQGELS